MTASTGARGLCGGFRPGVVYAEHCCCVSFDPWGGVCKKKMS